MPQPRGAPGSCCSARCWPTCRTPGRCRSAAARPTARCAEKYKVWCPPATTGPTGIVGVLQEACGRAELDALSFWVHVPHYANNPPCPKATLALLHRIEDVLDLPVPMADLAEEADEWEKRVRAAAEQDAELGEYVRELEERVGRRGHPAADRRRDRQRVREVPAPPGRVGRPDGRLLVAPEPARRLDGRATAIDHTESKSPAFTPVRNASHSARVKHRTPSSGIFPSRR